MSIKILIVGPAASGKTTLAKQLQAKGFDIGKLYTTRPPRDENDEEYYFCEPYDDGGNSFVPINTYDIVNYEVFVSCVFNGWKYTLTSDELDSCNVFIVGPKMAQMIKDGAPEHRYLTIFLDVPESIRYERLMLRDMPGDSVIARIGRDRADFAHFTDYDIRIHENHAQQPDVISNVVSFLKEQ